MAGDVVSANLISGAVTLPLASLAGEDMAGNVVTAALTLSLLGAKADGYCSTIDSASIELPAMLADGVTHNTGVTTASAATVALNTRVRAVTLYDGIAANSYARFAGMTLAATPNAIVALMGDTGLGTPCTHRVGRQRLRRRGTDTRADRLRRLPP